MNQSRHAAWRIISIVLLAVVSLAEAAPELRSTQIRYGSSIRAPENAWAIFSYRLLNRDSEPARVRIQLRPQRQRGGVIFDHEITVPAEAELVNEIPVTTTRDDTYVADLFFEGNLVASTEMLIKTALPSENVVMVLNDSDMGVGTISRNENLQAKYLTSPVGASTTPENWSGYDRVAAVIAVQPDWDRLTSRQTQALHDYVTRGGTLLVVDPNGAKALAESSLADLLPATILRLRPIDAIPASAMPGAMQAAEWPEGVPFAETLPGPNAQVTRQLDGYPLVCWHRFGLGTVVLCAAHPSRDGVPVSMRDAWWRHLFQFAGTGKIMQSSQGSRPLAKAVDTLTGLQIPARGPIIAACLGYLLLAAVVILLGVLTRRRLASWLVLCLVSIVATVIIFVIAGGQHDNRAARSASLIAFGEDTGANERIISLFSRNETRLTLAAKSAESRFRDVPPPPRDTRIINSSSAPRGSAPPKPVGKPGAPGKPSAPGPAKAPQRAKNVEFRDPINVTMREGKPHLEDAVLRGNAVRMHAVLETGTSLRSRDQLPHLPAKGPGSWVIPAEFSSSTGAAIILESGFSAATISAGKVTYSAGLAPDLKPPAADLAGIREAVIERGLQAPILLLSQPLSGVAADYDLPPEFELSGRTINLVAMRETLSAKVDSPFGRMPIRPTDGLARALHNQDGWLSTQQRTIASTYELVTHLPGSLLRLETDTLKVRFLAENRGRNVEFDVKLRPYDAEARDKSGDLAPTTQEGELWTFDLAKNPGFIDPSNGRIRVVLTASPIEKIVDPVAQQRANSWTIRQFEAAVTGNLAKQWMPRAQASKDGTKP